MTRLPLAFALVLVLGGCAGSQKHAETPDFTEKGWSDPDPSLTSAKTDHPIQPEVASAEPPSASPTPTAGNSSAPASAPDPAAGSSGDAAIISGNALPPPPNTAPATKAKATKGKKAKRKKKKTASG